jgi:hypothetical protein
MSESEKAFHIWFIQKYNRPPQVENANRLDRVIWEGFKAAWDIQEENKRTALRSGEFGA